MTVRLRELLDDAATSHVSARLARDAQVAAAHRRRQRVLVGMCAAAVAVVLVGVFAVVEPFQQATDDQNVPVASSILPARLPNAQALRSLAGAPMATAAAAYVVDHRVVLVNASTSEPVTLDPVRPSLSGSVSDPTAVALSPDGTRALVVEGAGGEARDLAGHSQLALVDIETQEKTTLFVSVSTSGPAASSLQLSELAWSPDSSAFACICTAFKTLQPRVRVVELTDVASNGRVTGAEAFDVSAARLSWTSGGLAVQMSKDRPWFALDSEGARQQPPVTTGDLFGAGGEPGSMLGVVRNFFNVSEPGSFGAGAAWTIEFGDAASQSLPGRPAFRRGTAVGLFAAGDNFVVVVESASRVRRPGGPIEPALLRLPPGGLRSADVNVVSVDPAGNQTLLTRLPTGTESFSVANLRFEPAARTHVAADAATIGWPNPQRLPNWDERPVAVAAAAYVAGGRLVLIDAQTGEGAVATIPVAPADQVFLSPEGGRLLWLDGSGVGQMVVVNLATHALGDGGHRWPISAKGRDPAPPPVAWEDADHVVCACAWDAVTDGPIGLFELAVAPDGSLAESEQIGRFGSERAMPFDGAASGDAGLAVHNPQTGAWWLLNERGEPLAEFRGNSGSGLGIGATTFARLGLSTDTGWYLTLQNNSRDAVSVRIPGRPLTAVQRTSASDAFGVFTGGDFAGRDVGGGGAGKLIVVESDGAHRVLASLPGGVSQASVASDWLASAVGEGLHSGA